MAESFYLKAHELKRGDVVEIDGCRSTVTDVDKQPPGITISTLQYVNHNLGRNDPVLVWILDILPWLGTGD